MKLVGFLFGLLVGLVATAQVSISANTVVEGGNSTIVLSGGIANRSDKANFGKATIILSATTATPSLLNNPSMPFPIGTLEINSKVDYGLSGLWLINQNLTLTSGKIKIAPCGKLIYAGTPDVEGNDNSYVQEPFFVQGNSGKRTFPIGDGIYAPVSLLNIEAADAKTEIGFAITSDPGFLPGGLIKEVFQGRFWQIIVDGGNAPGSYLGSQISLSSNGVDPSFAESPTILERKTDGTTNDLGASLNNTFFTSNTGTNAERKIYGIAKTELIKLKIHKLITPDNDQVNDVLVIEGLDNFETNEVTLGHL